MTSIRNGLGVGQMNAIDFAAWIWNRYKSKPGFVKEKPQLVLKAVKDGLRYLTKRESLNLILNLQLLANINCSKNSEALGSAGLKGNALGVFKPNNKVFDFPGRYEEPFVRKEVKIKNVASASDRLIKSGNHNYISGPGGRVPFNKAVCEKRVLTLSKGLVPVIESVKMGKIHAIRPKELDYAVKEAHFNEARKVYETRETRKNAPAMMFMTSEDGNDISGSKVLKKVSTLKSSLEPTVQNPLTPLPGIDIRSITDQVYSELQRRMRKERERRGL